MGVFWRCPLIPEGRGRWRGEEDPQQCRQCGMGELTPAAVQADAARSFVGAHAAHVRSLQIVLARAC